jgi:hypothetical protein
MKIVITGEPKDSYVGFYTPRGKPFMKASGGNEIVALSARSGVKCWMYG